MQENLETLNGTVEQVIFCNPDTRYTVLSIASDDVLYTAVGDMADVHEGEEVALRGTFTTHPNFGEQFRVEAYEVRLPETAAAIKRYLASGALPNVGRAMAERIVARFGEDALEVIASEPQKLTQIKGISAEKADVISRAFKEQYGVRETIMSLARYGLSSPLAVKMYQHYGPNAAEIVEHNPFVLCAYPAFQDFRTADAIAQEMSMEYNCPERVTAGLLFVLRHNLNNGHTCLPQDKLCAAASAFLAVEPPLVDEALRDLLEREELYCAQIGQRSFIYLPEYWRAEHAVAAHLRALMQMPRREEADVEAAITAIETARNIRYAPLQRQAIRSALADSALVLTGRPGTGKTTTINAMLAAFEQNGDRVALAAPTGRAAKSLSELTGREAKTIHRLLEVTPGAADTLRFVHNAKNPLKCDVIVVDEMSMVDVLLFENLLAALRPSCKIIMVGDEEQLPSVGAGNVLASVIASGIVPTVRLTEIFRQAAQSLIVSNAQRISQGQALEAGGYYDDFFMLESDGAACAQLVCDLVSRRLPRSFGFDPMQDIQVLCPSKIGPLGTAALNPMLQDCLNPPGPDKPQVTVGTHVLRLGDKVMQMSNNYDIPYTRADGQDGAGAFNGDMGVIEAVDVRAGSVTVRSEDRRYVYTSAFLRQLEPAYAVTIHKSQGNEFPAIVIPVMEVPPKLCYRNLLYTGVTRARSLCILAGHRAEMAQMVANVKNNKRFSCLAQFLEDEVL